MRYVPIIIIVVMIFLMFRAQRKQRKEQQEMLNRIVKGSKVMFCGIYGKVSEVREKEFLIEIAENVKVLVVREAVTLIEEKVEEKK